MAKKTMTKCPRCGATWTGGRPEDKNLCPGCGHNVETGFTPRLRPDGTPNAAFTYRTTHVSVLDGSPAMLVAQDGETVTLVNEDGVQWTDPRADWRPEEG